MIKFKGTCDVCGKEIGFEWDEQFMIDYLVDENDKLITWLRHYAIAPKGANPDCAIYSSRVYQVDD